MKVVLLIGLLVISKLVKTEVLAFDKVINPWTYYTETAKADNNINEQELPRTPVHKASIN